MSQVMSQSAGFSLKVKVVVGFGVMVGIGVRVTSVFFFSG